jgi:SAM-dependent methyltransferase
MKTTEDNLRREADFFSKANNALTRSVAWGAIPYFQQQIHRASNLNGSIDKLLSGRTKINALTLACGMMTGEYNFCRARGATSIDAYDISEGQRDKFFNEVYDGEIEVNYRIADVNAIVLEENKYDLIFIQQAYHHLVEVEYVAREINKALKPDGVFVLIDYIGQPFLQRTERQMDLAQRIWKTMPARLRTNHSGRVIDEVHIPDKSTMSPYEAVRADAIWAALTDVLEVKTHYFLCGILFPIFNGYAQNYTDSESDTRFIKQMWEIDRFLIETGGIEPNFVRAVFGKKEL